MDFAVHTGNPAGYLLLAEIADKEGPWWVFLLCGLLLAGAAMWCLQTRWKPAVAVPLFLLLLINYVELDTLRTEFGQAVIDELGVPAIVLRFVMLDGPFLAGSCWHWCRSPGSVQMVETPP